MKWYCHGVGTPMMLSVAITMVSNMRIEDQRCSVKNMQSLANRTYRQSMST